MRSIKYILINETVCKSNSRSACDCTDCHCGYHYVVTDQGSVLNPINISRPGSFMPKAPCGKEDFNKCSIGIRCNGSLEPGTSNVELRASLIRLLGKVRSHFPEAKIIGVSELDGWHIRASDAMNALRYELSDLP